jgi:hypothetical protein
VSRELILARRHNQLQQFVGMFGGRRAFVAVRREEVVPTESGAHTLALDRKRNKVYAFLPRSHRAAVFVDGA